MADLSGSFGTGLSAIIVSTAGTLWFIYVMKGLRTLRPTQRRMVYASVFAAYFVLTIILINHLGA